MSFDIAHPASQAQLLGLPGWWACNRGGGRSWVVSSPPIPQPPHSCSSTLPWQHAAPFPLWTEPTRSGIFAIGRVDQSDKLWAPSCPLPHLLGFWLAISCPHVAPGPAPSRPGSLYSLNYLVDPASSICFSQRLSHACLSTHGWLVYMAQ